MCEITYYFLDQQTQMPNPVNEPAYMELRRDYLPTIPPTVVVGPHPEVSVDDVVYFY